VVRAYAWRMTVERLLRILISAIRKQGFFMGLCAYQLPCAPSATAASSDNDAIAVGLTCSRSLVRASVEELILAAGLPPGLAVVRAVRNSKGDGGDCVQR
jgi:hypothetical protein